MYYFLPPPPPPPPTPADLLRYLTLSQQSLVVDQMKSNDVVEDNIRNVPLETLPSVMQKLQDAPEDTTASTAVLSDSSRIHALEDENGAITVISELKKDPEVVTQAMAIDPVSQHSEIETIETVKPLDIAEAVVQLETNEAVKPLEIASSAGLSIF